MSNYHSMGTDGTNGAPCDLSHDADYTSAEQLLQSLDNTGESSSGLGPYGDAGYKHPTQNNLRTDWNYGVEGLLPPLPRPDPNQMPPDVLAYILKSGKFPEALNSNTHDGVGSGNARFVPSTTGLPPPHQYESTSLTPTQNWSAQNNNPTVGHPQGYWTQNQSSAQSFSSSSYNPYQSNLSPLAAEFVPRQYAQQEPADVDVEFLRLALAEMNQNNFQQQNFPYDPQHQPQWRRFTPQGPRSFGSGGYRQTRPAYQPRHHSPRQRQFRQQDSGQQQFESNADRVLTAVTDTICHLTMNPADFHVYVKKLVRVLKESLTDADTLEIAVTLIVEQSVTNKNFLYTGAKLCQALNEHKIQVGEFTAQNCVFQHVQTVFESSMKSISTTSEALRERLNGLLFFLAELFINFKTDKGNFFGFGIAACEIMSALIRYEKNVSPSHDNVRTVANVLKLAGWELHKNLHPKLKEDLEKLMNDLKHLLEQEDVLPKTKEIIEKVFELKKLNWGRSEESSAASTTSSSPPSSVSFDGNLQETFFEEPSSSDEGEVYLDDESEEVTKCYDQFLNTLTAGGQTEQQSLPQPQQ